MLVSGMVATDNSSAPSYVNQDSTKSLATIASSTEAAPKKTATPATSSEVKQATKQPSSNLNANIESEVREYFADIPLMAEISNCESHFRQFEKDGSVFRGKINDRDVGAMQINEFYHAERAKKLGYNLHTLKGNLAYARLLYKEQGGQPWVSSSPCWKKSEVAKAIYGHEAVASSAAMRVALIEDFRDAQKNTVAAKVSAVAQKVELATNIAVDTATDAPKILADNI